MASDYRKCATARGDAEKQERLQRVKTSVLTRDIVRKIRPSYGLTVHFYMNLVATHLMLDWQGPHSSPAGERPPSEEFPDLLLTTAHPRIYSYSLESIYSNSLALVR